MSLDDEGTVKRDALTPLVWRKRTSAARDAQV
jgi:hypothetical protein